MRLRKVAGAKETIGACRYVISNKEPLKLDEIFDEKRPVFIEIGMGKGDFILGMANEYKEINFIGIEKFSSVLVRAIEKLEDVELSNLKFLEFDATKIVEMFEEGSVDKIFLNFSDPWPKSRHAKRRLMSPEFIDRYKKILSRGGEIVQKTDNKDLFNYSLEKALENGLVVLETSNDLHSSDFSKGNIMTEYEKRFSSRGIKINYARYKVAGGVN